METTTTTYTQRGGTSSANDEIDRTNGLAIRYLFAFCVKYYNCMILFKMTRERGRPMDCNYQIINNVRSNIKTRSYRDVLFQLKILKTCTIQRKTILFINRARSNNMEINQFEPSTIASCCTMNNCLTSASGALCHFPITLMSGTAGQSHK